MYHFCTLFDSNYLLRGLTLFRSLQRHIQDFQFYTLCLDQKSYDALKHLAIPNLHVISLDEIEAWEPRLVTAKQNRSRVEYFFTLSPALPLFLLQTRSAIDVITYMDADLYFYSSPAAIYKELADHSILIIEHRFPEHLAAKAVYGRFNVQYQSFRRSEQGLACLTRWHEQCLAWCYDRLEDNRFADQKYLNEWPELYDDLVILKNKGAGVAPWNWSTYPLNLLKNTFLIDQDPLIFYHFHAIKIIRPQIISHGLSDFGVMPRKYLEFFYKGYIRQLRLTENWLTNQGLRDFKAVDKKIHFRIGSSISKWSLIKEVASKLRHQIIFVF